MKGNVLAPDLVSDTDTAFQCCSFQNYNDVRPIDILASLAPQQEGEHMPSQSFSNLRSRLKDIDQLLDAHAALTKFKKAEIEAGRIGDKPNLKQIAAVVGKLVSTPGKGKPAEVDAINRAAFVLLSAHFQGFVDDMHKEVAAILLKGKVADIDGIVKLARPGNANPHPSVIEKMFGGLGIFEVTPGIKWQNCTNKSIKDRLTRYIEVRNKIAHGSKVANHETESPTVQAIRRKACAGTGQEREKFR
jgi:hypothetical protein